MPKPKKIPRAIKTELLDELKKIDKDLNKAIEKLLFANLRKGEPEKTNDMQEMATNLWPYLKNEVELIVDQAIEDAKRGYR